MTSRSAKFSGIALTALAMAVALSGCNTINHFRNKDDGPVAVASQGQRISIVAFEQKLEPSKSLKGVGYYLPPVQPVADWPTGSGPAGDLIQNADSAKAFSIAWVKQIGAASKQETEVVAQPVSDGHLIYVLDGQARVSAFDVNSGNEVWSRDLNPHLKREKVGFGGGLAVDGGKLYVTSGYRFIKALDAASGKELWSKTVDTPLHSPPTPANGMVFVTDVDNQIFAFDQGTGEMVWTYQAIAEPARILKASAPLVADGTIYAPFSSGEIVALTATKGEPTWDQVLAQSSRTNALSEIRDISGRPVIYRGDVYAVSHSGMMAAIDMRTGTQRWTLPVTSTTTPWPAGDVVFVSDTVGRVICASRDNGQIYWITDLNHGKRKKDRGVWSGPTLSGPNLVLVSSLGEAVALNPKTGAVQRTLKLGSDALMTPIAVGDNLYVATQAAELIAIR